MKTLRPQLEILAAQIANQDGFVSPKQQKRLKCLDGLASEAQETEIENFSDIFSFREEIRALLEAGVEEFSMD